MAPGSNDIGGVIIRTWAAGSTGDYGYETADGRTGIKRGNYSLPEGVETAEQYRARIEREARWRR